MLAPTRNDTLTSTLKLVVDWVALTAPQNGYSDIQSYNLQWFAGNKSSTNITWINLVGLEADQLIT